MSGSQIDGMAEPSSVEAGTGAFAPSATTTTVKADDLVPPPSSTVMRDKESAHESMAEPELLALIIEMRLQAGRRSTNGKEKKGNVAPSSAIDTMDLCHRKIQKLPEEMVDIIKDDVVRLALGYNFITALPNSFMDLSKLRYLNVRANLMSTFPTVLCSLPSLEILDMSRNKIRRLPSEPGRLTELRVLSLSNNRLRRLPTWLTRSRHLRILKLEGNPLNWPPPHISVMPPADKASVSDGGAVIAAEEPQSKDKSQLIRKKAVDRHMLVWIARLKQWIEQNREQAEVEESGTIKEDERSPIDVQHARPPQLPDGPEEDERSRTLKEERDDATTKGDVDREAASEDDKERDGEVIALPVPAPQADSTRTLKETPRAQSPDEDGHVKTSFSSTQVAHSQEALARPEDSDKGKAELAQEVNQVAKRPSSPPPPVSARQTEGIPPLPTLQSPNGAPKESKPIANEGEGRMSKQPKQAEVSTSPGWSSVSAPSIPLLRSNHARNNSHSMTMSSASTPPATRKGLLRNKKSLPDLRQNHATILTDRQEGMEIMESSEGEDAQNRNRRTVNQPRRPPLPHAHSESGLSARSLAGPHPSGELLRKKLSPITTSGPELETALQPRRPSNATETTSATPLSSTEHESVEQGSTSAAAVESERNSYFKRLSTLPTSTISTTVSVPVLLCIDATRGVLYALSQMHTALRQYVTFATDERMTSQLSRVLVIAGSSMATLIHSLDRFDSLSRIRGDALDPTVVRGVIISCIESIGTFRKLVHVVQLQLRSLQRGADVRYTRTLLLLLHGSLAEISYSWKTLEPLLDDVAPYLSMGMVHPAGSHGVQQAGYLHPGLPSIAEATSPVTPSTARMAAPPSRPQRRRHAGSFSAQDLAHGASMSSSGSFLTGTPAVPGDESRRAIRPPALSTMPQLKSPSHVTAQGSEGMPENFKAANGAAPNQHIPPNRRTLSNISGTKGAGNAGVYSKGETNEPPIDDHLLQLVVKITSVAFSVWAGIQEHLISLGLPSKRHTNKPSNGMGAILGDDSGQKTEGAPGSLPKTPSRTARSARQQISEASTVELPETPDRSLMRSADPDSTLVGSTPHSIGSQPQQAGTAAPSPAVQRRLRQLHDLTRGVHEHTHRLHACLERAQDAIGGTPTPLSPPSSNRNGAASVRHPRTGSNVSSVHSNSTPSDPHGQFKATQGRQGDSSNCGSEGDSGGHPPAAQAKPSSANASRELFVECSHFIKSILHISHFIKSMAAEGFVLPKYVKASMAELTTCARDLTLHLHFLSGPAPSTPLAAMPLSAGAVTATTAQAATHMPASSAPATVSMTPIQHQHQQNQRVPGSSAA